MTSKTQQNNNALGNYIINQNQSTQFPHHQLQSTFPFLELVLQDEEQTTKSGQ
jgi:hypothetical protein